MKKTYFYINLSDTHFQQGRNKIEENNMYLIN